MDCEEVVYHDHDRHEHSLSSFVTKRQEDARRECEQISGQKGRMVGIRIYRLINFIVKKFELSLGKA